MPLISIIIPVIRPDSASRCIDSIERNTSDWQHEIISEEDVAPRIGCPKMVKRLADRSRGELVCFLGDDTMVQPGWLTRALGAMTTLPDGWGLVSLTDQTEIGSERALHWLADKRLLPLLGGEFFYTGYRHSFSDNELSMRCKELGRYAWTEEIVLEHDNPVSRGETPFGTDHETPFQMQNYYHDYRLFRNRQKNGWKT